MLLYKLYVDVVKVNSVTTSKSLRVFVSLSDDTNAIIPAKTVNKACKVHAVVPTVEYAPGRYIKFATEVFLQAYL